MELSKAKKDLIYNNKFGKVELFAVYNNYNTPRTLAPLIPRNITPNVVTSKDIYTIGANYNVKLYSGGEISSNIEIEKYNKTQSASKLNLTKKEIIYNIKSLYLSILANQELLKAWQKNSIALKKLVDLIEYEVSLGKKSNLDLIKAKVDLTDSKINEDNIASFIKSLFAKLSKLLGQEITYIEPIDFEVKEFKIDKFDINNLEKVKISEFEIQKTQQSIKKTKAKNYPQVYLSANYSKNYDDSLANNEELTQLTLNIKWNIFDFGSTKKEIELNKIKKKLAQIKKEETILNLQKDIKIAINEINLNYQKYKSNIIQVKLAKQTYKIEQARYKSNASTLNDLLLAKAKEQLSISKLIQAKYDYLKSRYYLEYLIEKGRIN
jgi:outer membrane protein TolC